MRSNLRFGLPLFLLLALLVLFNGNHLMGLFETSEARYAEVAREMAATGDYLSPQVDYVYHFTKPPLTYWLTAGAYRLFGANTFGARFVPGMSALLVLLLTALLFRRKVPDSRGILPAAVLLATMEFFALGKVLTTDMLLTLWITTGFLLWTFYEEERLSGRWFAFFFGLAAAAAFLTKGPVPLLFWAVVLLPYGLWKDRGRSLLPFLSPSFWVPFLSLSLPWFLLAGRKHPGLLVYLLTKEATEAAVSSERFHPGSWYFYIGVLLAGLFPWWLLLASRWRETLPREVRLWLLWAVAPVVVWSLFPAKLPTYILATFPAWALLAGWVLKRKGEPGRAVTSLMALGCTVVPVAVGTLLAMTYRGVVGSPWTFAFLGISAALGVAAVVLGVKGRGMRSIGVLVACILAFETAVPYLVVDAEPLLKIEKSFCENLVSQREPDEAVLEYQATLFSVPFHIRDRVAAYDNSFTRKKYIGELPSHILQNEGDLQAFIDSHPRLWVVTDRDGEETLGEDIPGLHLVLRGGRHSLWATEAVQQRLQGQKPEEEDETQ